MAGQGQPDGLSPEIGWGIIKYKLLKWGLVTIDPLLLVAHLTIIYIAFLIADDFVLAQIERSFGDLISQSAFAAALLRGTKIFAALGTALGYALHLVYSLYRQAKHVVKTIQESKGEGDT